MRCPPLIGMLLPAAPFPLCLLLLHALSTQALVYIRSSAPVATSRLTL